MIKIKGYEVKNTAEEITIEEFDTLNTLEGRKDLPPIEKWIEKFKALGVDEEVFDDMTGEEFTETVRAFNAGFEDKRTKTLSIEIDGYTYETKESISVKDLSLIEHAMKSNVTHFAKETASIIFKRKDLTRTEHYTEAHLKHKASLFKDQPCSIVVPFIKDVIESIVKSTESVVDGLE